MTENNLSEPLEIIAEDLELLETLNSQNFRENLLRHNRFRPYPNRETLNEMNPNSSNTNLPQTMSRQDIQLLLNSIPEFSPGRNLSIFINEVDNLCAHLQGRLTPDLQFCLNFSIRSKILNEARDFIAFQNATEWSTIRRALLQRYGDQRNEDLLVTAITQCVQRRNENYLDYYCRISKNFSDLLQHLSLNIQDQALLTYKKFEAEKLSLKTFQIGLLEPYRSYISNFELNSLEECINKCKFYDNRKQEWEYSEFLRKSQENKNKPPFPYEFKQTKNYNTQPILRQQFPNNNQFSKVRNANLNQNHRNIVFPQNTNPVNQKYFTNQEVFGTKPGSSMYKRNQEPTPMSISTRNTKPVPMSISTRNSRFPQKQIFNVQSSNPETAIDQDIEYFDPEYFEEINNFPEEYEENYESDENFQQAPLESSGT